MAKRTFRYFLPVAFGAASLLAYFGGGFQLSQWGWFGLSFCMVAIVGMFTAPLERVRLSGIVRSIGLAAIAAYCVWTAIAISWSADRFAAHEETARTMMYATCVLVGLVGSRYRSGVQWAIVAWVVSGAAVAGSMLAQVTGPAHTSLMLKGQLLGTLTYHNAEAALLLMPIPAALSLSSLRSIDPGVRALMLGASTMFVATAVLTQSRGGLVGLIVAMAVLFVLSPVRTRLALHALVAFAPIVVIWGALIDVFHAGRLEPDRATPELAAAIPLIVGASLISLVVGIVISLADGSYRPPRWIRRTTSVVLVGGVCVAVAVILVEVPTARTPVSTLRSEWRKAADAEPSRSTEPSSVGRFSQLGNGTAAARIEQWRVAIRDVRDHPVRGVGPANWEATFYQYRSKTLDRYVRQPHQLTLEVLAERGIVGGVLFAIALLAIVATGLRARMRSQSERSKALIAGLMGVCAYWLAHAQLDWIWQMGALTVPAMLAAGCLLGAPWRLPADTTPVRRRWRALLVAVPLATAVVIAPLVIAERSVERSGDAFTSGRERPALEYARRATRWAPHWARSWQVRADAHDLAGERPAADRAARRSVRQSPEHWASYVWLADYWDRQDRFDNGIEVRLRAYELNPLDPDLNLPAG